MKVNGKIEHEGWHGKGTNKVNHSMEEEFSRRVHRWSKKDDTRRELDNFMHQSDEKLDGRLLKMVEDSHYNLSVE